MQENNASDLDGLVGMLGERKLSSPKASNASADANASVDVNAELAADPSMAVDYEEEDDDDDDVEDVL